MINLLKKEFSLAFHPVTSFMLLLSFMVFIPNYPYTVIFFYINLAVFFICLLGRENNDVKFTLLLPVRKTDVVRVRLLFVAIIELIHLVFLLVLVAVKNVWLPAENLAGVDANLTLIAEGLIIDGAFNLVFFCSYYKNIKNVGLSLVKGSVITFLLVITDVITANAVSYFKQYFDNTLPQFVQYRIFALAVGAALYIVLTVMAHKISSSRIEKQDV